MAGPLHTGNPPATAGRGTACSGSSRLGLTVRKCVDSLGCQATSVLKAVPNQAVTWRPGTRGREPGARPGRGEGVLLTDEDGCTQKECQG